MNVFLFAIPAWLDTIETCLKAIATTMIASSVVQMLKSTILVYCALLALIFLKKKLYRHHWASMLVIILGVALVGIGYLTGKPTDNNYSSSDIIFGLVLL